MTGSKAGDLNDDGLIDQKDLNILLTSVNKPALGANIAEACWWKRSLTPYKDESGYSGYTAFVRNTNGWPAEIQLNIATILYAKDKDATVGRVLGDTEFNGI